MEDLANRIFAGDLIGYIVLVYFPNRIMILC